MTISLVSHFGLVLRRSDRSAAVIEELQASVMRRLEFLASEGLPLPLPEVACPQDEHLFSCSAGTSEFDVQAMEEVLTEKHLAKGSDYVFMHPDVGVVDEAPAWLRCERVGGRVLLSLDPSRA